MTKKKQESELKQKMGRPTKYNPDVHLAITAQAYANGATDVEVSRILGVSIATVYVWKNTHPDFLEASRVGRRYADHRVERAVYEAALGFEMVTEKTVHSLDSKTKELKEEHHTTFKKIPPDFRAAQFWLTNRDPDNWRAKVEVGIGIAEDDPLLQILNRASGRALPISHDADKKGGDS